MKLAAITAALVVAATAAHAQTMTREQTFSFVSTALADIQHDAANEIAISMKSPNVPRDTTLQPIINQILAKVANLRDKLVGNPYLRITGYSVTIPFRVHVNFEFPDQ